MKTSGPQLFLAKEFANATGVTVRTLHHYDQIGLLKPNRYTESGYRLYRDRDITRLQQIVILKFLGLSLKQIGRLIGRKTIGWRTTLQIQRKIVEEKRRHLDLVLRSIDEAARLLSTTGEASWKSIRKIVEVIKMEQQMGWVKKYYTDEQLKELAKRDVPEIRQKGEREWGSLIQEVEAARYDDPTSEKAQALADRWAKLIEAFTGGNPGIKQGLKKFYADQAHWPSTFKKPYSDEAEAFIKKAMDFRRKGKY